VVEIMEQVYLEIKNYGHDDQKKKLIGGVVLTGGGSQLKHLKQLVEYITGMDTRIGYPSEHLAGDTKKSETSPILATAVGLLMNALEQQVNKDFESVPSDESEITDNTIAENTSDVIESNPMSSKRKSILDRWVEKFKEFLDNA
jgi:cell division protein FtsA